MKLLYLTAENMSLDKGSVVHVREVVCGLRALGCQVTLVGSRDLSDGNSRRGVSARRRGDRQVTLGGMLCILWRLIRLLTAASLFLPFHDLAYARDFHVTLACLIPKIVYGKRLIYEVNGVASEEWLMKGTTRLHRIAASGIKASERLAARVADRIVAVTDGLKDYLVWDLGVEAEKIAVVPNGVDTRVFHPEPDPESLETLRKSLGIQDDEQVAVFVGNLAPWQGIDTLLDCAPMVLKSLPQTKFLIVGDGAVRGFVEARIKAMDLSVNVVLTGMVPNRRVPQYINLADVCVSPKRDYATGLSPLKIYEYMACGKPIISSRTPGLEFIGEASVGKLVEAENPVALARGIIELLMDDRKRECMGRNGTRLARQEFDWRKLSLKILRVLHQEANRGPVSKVRTRSSEFQ
jgi:glycosyltransferase involved in cell wall biosynthesis